MAKVISGTAAVFDSRSEDLGFFEYIAPGAFDAVLRQKQDVLCLWNHSHDALLGRTASGTVRLWQDNIGLRYECDLPGTHLGGDIGALVDRGDITGSSFGFIVGEDDWNVERNGDVLRRVLSVAQLIDVSPVTVPAYPGTTKGGAAVKAVRNARREPSAEDKAWLDGVRRTLDAESAKQRAADEWRIKKLREVAKQAGLETAALDAKLAEMQTATRAATITRTAKRTYSIGGKSCTRAQFLDACKRAGVSGIEQRLSNAGKVERHIASNAEVIGK